MYVLAHKPRPPNPKPLTFRTTQPLNDETVLLLMNSEIPRTNSTQQTDKPQTYVPDPTAPIFWNPHTGLKTSRAEKGVHGAVRLRQCY